MPEVHTTAPMTHTNSGRDSFTSDNIVFLLRGCGLPQWRVISESNWHYGTRRTDVASARAERATIKRRGVV